MTPSSSLFSRYLKEASDVETIELDGGFVAYTIEEDCINIDHIYVAPEKRGTSLFTELCASLRPIAQRTGKSFVECAVDILGPRAKKNLLIYLRHGFELKSLGRRHIFLRLNIEDKNGIS